MLLFFALLASIQGCTGFFFLPERGRRLTPDELQLAYSDVWFESSDGVKLHGWFLPAAGERRGTIVFFHGNAQNISTHIGSVYWLPAEGFDVFLADYRGYGESSGKPTLAGLHLDEAAALKWTFENPAVDPNKIIVFAQSLGGSIALETVAASEYRLRLRALVVDSAFSGYRKIAREKLYTFWLTKFIRWPLALLVSDEFRPEEAAAKISPLPLLIVHGANDPVVSVSHSETLYLSANEPKKLWIVPGAGHIQGLLNSESHERFLAYLKASLENSVNRR